MRFARAIRNAALSVWRQRRRSTLAGLGVTVGVAVLVAMVSVGEGAEQAVLQHFHSMGTDLVVASAGKVTIVAGRARQISNVTTLTVQDAQALESGLPHVRLAAPVQSQRLPVKWRELSTQTNIVGTTPAYLSAKNVHVQFGRGFEEEELRGALRVAVLGPSVVGNLFGDVAPLGEAIRINKIPFEAVGVLAAPGLDPTLKIWPVG